MNYRVPVAFTPLLKSLRRAAEGSAALTSNDAGKIIHS
jgi:hypothetical protein